MPPTRSALYLDFDNVFGGLLQLDPRAAIDWADNPGRWLSRLSIAASTDASRRWLVLRCYMNPGGAVANPLEPGSRLYFSQFRRHFTDAGFEIVDCPRLNNTKNAADIRLVVDALDAIHGPVTYDEFVICSGDSDMTPLLVRLRAADRRTTVMSPSESAAIVLTAVADQVIDGPRLIELVAPAAPADDEADEYAEREEGAAPPVIVDSMPEPVARISGQLGLPRLTSGAWHLISERLGAFVADREYNLTEATRWVRDDLTANETVVSRKAVNLVVFGATHGGCPLYRQPPPTGAEILSAFADNVVNRAQAADADLTSEEVGVVRSWFESKAV
jgi:hypothetical protein